MVSIRPILDVTLALQSTALLGENIKAAKMNLKSKKSEKPLKRIVRTGVTNIVGVSLIRTQAQLIGGIK